MQSISRETISGVFEKTGIYPLNRSKITADLLVGDERSKPSNQFSNLNSDIQTDTPLSAVKVSGLKMQVFNERGDEIRDRKDTHQDIGIQTLPVATLSCSTCISNDVHYLLGYSVH